MKQLHGVDIEEVHLGVMASHFSWRKEKPEDVDPDDMIDECS